MTQDNHLGERGSAMLLAVGVMGVLAVIALIAVGLATSEKWSALAGYTSTRAFYSADAAGEAGINWIRRQASPPDIIDGSNHVFRAAGFTLLSTDHSFKHDIRFVRKRFRPGWSPEYKDYEYEVVADGASRQQSEAGIDIQAIRFYREGY